MEEQSGPMDPAAPGRPIGAEAAADAPLDRAQRVALAHQRRAERAELRRLRALARAAHPFDRDTPGDPDCLLYDNGRQADALLVAFAGAKGQLSVAAVDVFERLVDLPVRIVFVRRIERAGVPRPPGALGGTVPQVQEQLAELARGARRVAFMGNSLGGYLALLHGTLLGVDGVLAVNPTTSLLEDVRAEIGDTRAAWEGSSVPADAPRTHLDLVPLWTEQPGPPVLMHYAYRSPVYCGHAERIAEFPWVRPIPHYWHSPMATICRDGTLRADVAQLLELGATAAGGSAAAPEAPSPVRGAASG